LVPYPDLIGGRAVSNENGVDRRPEEAFDADRVAGVDGNEIAQWSQHGAVRETLSFAQQSGCRGRQSHALTLESLEGADLSLECRQCFIGPKELRARRNFTLTRGRCRSPGHVALLCRRFRPAARDLYLFGGRFGLTPGTRNFVEELRALIFERPYPHGDLRSLALPGFAIELQPTETVAGGTGSLLGSVNRRSCGTHCVSCRLLVAMAARGVGSSRHELGCECLALFVGPPLVIAKTGAVRFALGTLRFRARAAREGVALSLLGDRDFPLQLECALAQRCHQASEFGAPPFGRGTSAVCFVPRGLGVVDAPLCSRRFLAQQTNALLESRQLITPHLHFARRVRNLEREPASHQFGVTLGTFPLARQ
jgi:hypothetical protein